MPRLNDPLHAIDSATRIRLEAERTIPVEHYREHGADSRLDYFLGLHLNYEIDVAAIVTIADVLGPDEDFDGLITAIEDGAEGYGFAMPLIAEYC